MSVEQALEKFLKRILSRSRLSSEEQQAILALKGRVSNAAPRVDIVSPGETVDHACLIAEGIAARFDQMRNGLRQITCFHIPGDMSDLHSVVAPTAAWGIAALSPARVVFVPHAGLRELVVTYPCIALAFWRDGTADASILAKWVGNLGRQDARARLAHILCEFGIRMEQAGLGTRTSFDLAITQEQLADAAGLTPVHVNRTLQRLRSEGLIATRSQHIDIPDWERLVDVAEFDPNYLLLGDQMKKSSGGTARNPAFSIAE
jgi:CRP-like cAMP-binding protein